jgi:hypothetical protein
MIERPSRFYPPAMEPKIKQQLSNNTYASREKECTPSGVLKGSWDGLILYVYFLQGRLKSPHILRHFVGCGCSSDGVQVRRLAKQARRIPNGAPLKRNFVRCSGKKTAVGQKNDYVYVGRLMSSCHYGSVWRICPAYPS